MRKITKLTPILVLLLLSIPVVTGAAIYFFTSQTVQHQITIVGGTGLLLRPTLAEYSLKTPASQLELLDENTDGGGTTNIADCVVLVLDGHNFDYVNQDLDLLVEVIILEVGTGVTPVVTAYHILHWENSVPAPVTNIYPMGNIPIGVDYTIPAADIAMMEWTDVLIPSGDPRTEAESSGIVLSFTFEDGLGAYWGDVNFDITVSLGIA